jgi:membrane-associated phospholipid phosphatase
MISQLSMQTTGAYWQLITQLGSSSLLFPVLAISVATLWMSDQKVAIYLWLTALTLAVTVTLATKLLFLGWGIGIASLDFTGVSGHTLLATSILPILFFSVGGGAQTKLRNIGLWFGLLLGFAVGVSRVVLGMHSISEVIAGWVLGLIVCSVAIYAIKSHRQGLVYLQLLILSLLLVFGSATPNYIPAHDMSVKLALYLSGHDQPFTRSYFTAATPPSQL